MSLQFVAVIFRPMVGLLFPIACFAIDCMLSSLLNGPFSELGRPGAIPRQLSRPSSPSIAIGTFRLHTSPIASTYLCHIKVQTACLALLSPPTSAKRQYEGSRIAVWGVFCGWPRCAGHLRAKTEPTSPMEGGRFNSELPST